MMNDMHVRIGSFQDLHIRSSSSERTVTGLAAPFNKPAPVTEGNHSYTETLKKGCFTRSIQQRASKIKVYAKHAWIRGGTPIGSARVLEEMDEGLYCELKLAKTREADDALELITEEVYDSMSVGFHDVAGGNAWSQDRRAVVRNEVKLFEISVTERPTWGEASIIAVRSLNMLEELQEPQDTLPIRNSWELRMRQLGLITPS